MSLWGGLASEARPSANMSECERIDERQRGILYRGPMVGAKCSYQTLEPWHVRVDVVEWGPELHTSAWRGTFDRRGDLQNKGLWLSSKNVCKERKTSICLIRLVWAKERRGHRLVSMCWVCEQVMRRGLMELVFILVERGCWSLFVGAIVAF